MSDKNIVDSFIRVARIIANLDAILAEAKNLSLTAKNARVVALRAGDSASGFKPITNFIDEFSEQTIKTTTHISTLSNQLFKIALEAVRSTQFDIHVGDATILMSTPQLVTLQHKAKLDRQQQTKKLEIALLELESFFEEINKQMRSAEYIAVTSRVEASNAGEFSDSLQSVSDFIASAARTIKQSVTVNLNEIHTLRGTLH
ncbi:chemotaxis protein [Pseudoalteromonas sp. OOF1S-7]|uniref:chemotaxis protein n=1 Tax=Pseudoalteromonas sp. OOF1S-7 TaxID=2917757 RepID=UPI001EF40CC8|nr:chemotaxis protein [Pseudoalteromonas sp. OOF1S-7]MCG7537229.1 chemotaxis protein [Pseudoalteromonas sp. OOF1S-7]